MVTLHWVQAALLVADRRDVLDGHAYRSGTASEVSVTTRDVLSSVS